MNIDPNLHQKQGINHLNRVLGFAPMVAEGGQSTVHLTAEDWHVVADTLFHMQTPRELIPSAISDFVLDTEGQKIQLKTADLTIFVEMI